MCDSGRHIVIILYSSQYLMIAALSGGTVMQEIRANLGVELSVNPIINIMIKCRLQFGYYTFGNEITNKSEEVIVFVKALQLGYIYGIKSL